jgi:NADH-ubiquinone oxidoreductase chain 2
MALVAILTSVISAVYYLNVVKNIFFFKDEYKINPFINELNSEGSYKESQEVNLKVENIVLSSALSNVISVLTLILLLFMFIPNEGLNLANILTLILFKP